MYPGIWKLRTLSRIFFSPYSCFFRVLSLPILLSGRLLTKNHVFLDERVTRVPLRALSRVLTCVLAHLASFFSSPLQRVSDIELEEDASVTLLVGESCPTALREAHQGCHGWRLGSFELLKVLGQGYASTVYHARCQRSGQQVAIKQYHKGKLSPLNQFQVRREGGIHARLQHPAILPLFAVFEDRTSGECAGAGTPASRPADPGSSTLRSVPRDGALQQGQPVPRAEEAGRQW